MEEISAVYAGGCSTLLEKDGDGGVKLKSCLKIVFFTSQTPCK